MNYRLDFFDGRGLVRDHVEFSATSDGEALSISVGHIVRDPCSDRQCAYQLWRDAVLLAGSGMKQPSEMSRARKRTPERLSGARIGDFFRRGYSRLVQCTD